MHLGIDWGTSYTKIGYWENGKLINLAGQSQFIPTVVTYLPSTGRLYFGNTALRLNEPGACCAQFFKLELKRNLGYTLGPYDLPDILKEFFSFLNREYVIPLDQPVESITIGIPNYFGLKARRVLLKTITTCFGIKRVNMLLEPAAAALGYNLLNPEQPVYGDILSIDIGGGTSDFSFLTIEADYNRLIVESQLQTGHDVFSGSEIDRAILRNIFFPAFKIQTGRYVADNLLQEKSLAPQQNFKLNQMLRRAESLKKELGTRTLNYLNIPDFYEGQSLILTVDQDMFFSQTQPVFKRLEEYIEQSLKSKAAYLGLYQSGKWNLDYILLVGGASLILGVKELLATTFNNVPIILPANREFNVLAGLSAWETQHQSRQLTSIKTIYPFHFFAERFDPVQQSTILDRLPFDTTNLSLDTENRYKIFTLARDSVYNLSSDCDNVKFRVYEAAEEENNIVAQRFSDRDLVLEIDELKTDLPDFLDIYLDLAGSELKAATSSQPGTEAFLSKPGFFPGLLNKQTTCYNNYQKLHKAKPDLLDNYQTLLKLKERTLHKPYQDHIQATLFKLYALIDLLKF